MTVLEGGLLFAGVPLAIVALTFALVFRTTPKPRRAPITKPILDDDEGSGGASAEDSERMGGDEGGDVAGGAGPR